MLMYFCISEAPRPLCVNIILQDTFTNVVHRFSQTGLTEKHLQIKNVPDDKINPLQINVRRVVFYLPPPFPCVQHLSDLQDLLRPSSLLQSLLQLDCQELTDCNKHVHKQITLITGMCHEQSSFKMYVQILFRTGDLL